MRVRADAAAAVLACAAAVALLVAPSASRAPYEKRSLPSADGVRIEDFDLRSDRLELQLINNEATPVTIAQVQIDAAYWEFGMTPSTTIASGGRATLTLPYAWDQSAPITVTLVTSFGGVVPLELSPETGLYRVGIKSWRLISPRHLATILVISIAGALALIAGLAIGMPLHRRARDFGLLALSGLVVWQMIQRLMADSAVAMLIPFVWHGTTALLLTAAMTGAVGLLLQVLARRWTRSIGDAAALLTAAIVVLACHVAAAAFAAADAASMGQDADIPSLVRHLFVLLAIRIALAAAAAGQPSAWRWPIVAGAVSVSAASGLAPALAAPALRPFLWGSLLSAATLGADAQLLVTVWRGRHPALSHAFTLVDAPSARHPDREPSASSRRPTAQI
jgi:zinc transporter, ZIP family